MKAKTGATQIVVRRQNYHHVQRKETEIIESLNKQKTCWY